MDILYKLCAQVISHDLLPTIIFNLKALHNMIFYIFANKVQYNINYKKY